MGIVASTVYSATLAGPVAALIRSGARADVKVGMGEVARMRETRMRINSGGDLMGSGIFRTRELHAEYRRAVTMLHGSFATEALQQEAHAEASSLTRAVAFEAYDFGRHDEARKLWVAALAMAREAHPSMVPVLQGHVVENMARQAIALGHPDQALDLLNFVGGSREGRLPTVQRAMLNGVRAQATAGMGELNETRRLIERAEDHHNDPLEERDMQWNPNGWYHRGEMNGEATLALATLAEHHKNVAEEAVIRVTASLANYRTADTRSKTRVQTTLARLHAVLGDPDLTETATHAAIDGARHLRSPRINGELVALRPLLRRWHTRSGIVEADREIRMLAAG
jgi:hypothetical protein